MRVFDARLFKEINHVVVSHSHCEQRLRTAERVFKSLLQFEKAMINYLPLFHPGRQETTHNLGQQEREITSRTDCYKYFVF